MARTAKTRRAQAPKTANAENFYVAPTTPFIPKRRMLVSFSVEAEPVAPSVHVIDLRAATVARPHRPGAVARALRESAPAMAVPRTVSERPDRPGVWNELALVAFGKFLFAVGVHLTKAAAKAAAWPVKRAVETAEKFDLDRPQALEAPAASSDRETAKSAPPAARPLRLRRAILSFAGASLAVILPIQGITVYRDLVNAKDQAYSAKEAVLAAAHGYGSLASAKSALLEARESVDGLGRAANALIASLPAVGSQFRSGKALLEAGSDVAAASALAEKALSRLNEGSLTLTEKIAQAAEIADEAAPLLAKAKDALQNADDPPGMDLSSLRSQLASLSELADAFVSAAPALQKALGSDESRRYLVLFQNNAELRPTGGFIGSFALVDVDRGAIRKVEVPAGGPYDLQGSLKANVLAPEPIRLISAKWEFQDANWYPDFPASAKKLAWFYEKSGGPSVDGVMAINAPLLSKLLDIIGPIGMPEYGTVATGTTVLKTAQEIVESRQARESGKPKQFIADLLPKVLGKTMSGNEETTLKIFAAFAEALAEKDVQLYFSSEEEERAAARLGWSGSLEPIPAGFDSLSAVRANIAGGKTDSAISESISLVTEISDDGTVTDHATVTLSHGGKKGDPFTGVRNVTYLRVYVPGGSRLIKAEGDIKPPAASLFDIPPEGATPDFSLAEITGPVLHDRSSGTAVNEEFGRTAFGVWMQTDPGKSSTVTFEYVLPFKVTPPERSESLAAKMGISAASAPAVPFGTVFEKQPGAGNASVSSTLKLPAGWYPALAEPSGIAQPDGWSADFDLKTDRSLGILVSR